VTRRVASKKSLQRPDVVIATIGPLGADLAGVTDLLFDHIRPIGYEPKLIRLSELLHGLARWSNLPLAPLDTHISSHQRAGNDFRRVTGDKAAMALLGMAEIRRLRSEKRRRPLPKAFVIRSLKRKEEVERLRDAYGTSLFVIAGHAPVSFRIDNLARQIAQSRSSADTARFVESAKRLIKRDTAELDTGFGQDLRSAFPMADAIVDASNADDLAIQIERLVRILFSSPFETPTRAEFAMVHAKAAALRSADLGRQVGAAIVNKSGDVIAVGTNEVPRADGGLYWTGDEPDGRDFRLPANESQKRRRDTLSEVVKALASLGWINKRSQRDQSEEAIRKLSIDLKDTRLMNLGEFGRTVHAEMAALLDAARRGVAVAGADLYSTTFPCHNCAKHIVAAGIKRVRFIDPYPESLADELHADSVSVDPASRHEDPQHIRFETFVGVTPRRYFECFSMPKRRDQKGEPLRWEPKGATPRFSDWRPSRDLEELTLIDAFQRTLRAKKLL
jgi:cytidine deaminase